MIVEIVSEEAIRVTAEQEAPVNVTVQDTATPIVVEVGIQGPPGGAEALWENVTGKPSTFPPSSHHHPQSESHDSADTDSATTALHHTLGTGANQAAAGNHLHDTNYEPKNSNIQSHIASTSNPHSVTKTQVGLGNCDNTSDINKPVSIAQQTALDGKISHSLATAVNDFLVASGVGQFVKKTVAEVKAILGLGSAAYTESTAYATSSHGHSATDVTQDSAHRFVTDTQMSTWNGKQDALGYTPVNTNDSRLSDARTPTAHKASHATGGGDALTASDIGAATSGHNHDTAYEAKNSNIQTHIAATGNPHSTTPGDIGAATSGHNHAGVYAPAANGVTNGDNHDHSGGDGGAITEAALSLSDNTTGNVSTTKHGFCPKAPNDTTQFLRGDATWAQVISTPPALKVNMQVSYGGF